MSNKNLVAIANFFIRIFFLIIFGFFKIFDLNSIVIIAILSIFLFEFKSTVLVLNFSLIRASYI